MSHQDASAIWQHMVSAPDAPIGFTMKEAVSANNPNGHETMLEMWEAGSEEPAHSHPGDDMTVVVDGRMRVQFFTRDPDDISALVPDGEPIELKRGDTAYIPANRIHDAKYLETCRLVYVHSGPFGFKDESVSNQQ